MSMCRQSFSRCIVSSSFYPPFITNKVTRSRTHGSNTCSNLHPFFFLDNNSPRHYISRRTFARSRKVIFRKETETQRSQEGPISRNREITELTNVQLDRLLFNKNSNKSKAPSLGDVSSLDSLSHSEWIPPNRPLSGDSSSSSQLNLQKSEEVETDVIEDWEKQVENEQLKSVIKNEAKLTGRSVQYFDLDKMDMETMDWKKLEEQLKGWDSTSDQIDAASLEQLFDKEEQLVKAHELGDDDGWEDIHDVEDTKSRTTGRRSTWDDPILKEILSDDDLFDENDEEAMKIQLQLVAERLQQIRDEKKQKKSLDAKTTASTLSLPRTASTSASTTTTAYPNPSQLSTLLSASPSTIMEDKFFPPQNSQTVSPRPLTTGNRDNVQGPNWLQTRQRKMQMDNTATRTPRNMMLPSEAEERHKLNSSIPIITHTLLSSREIVSCLTALGGQDIKVIIPDGRTKNALGWDGLIVATGSSYAHIRVMADAIVKNLRLRDLASKGVVGAIYGVEGGDNELSSSYRNRKTGRGSNNKDDGWMIVDCRNYVVHIQDDMTRKSIDLESLWSPGERGKGGRLLRQVSSLNEDQVDDYVAHTPIPDDYTNSLMSFSAEIHGLMSNASLKQRKSSFQNTSKGKSKISNRSKSRF